MSFPIHKLPFSYQNQIAAQLRQRPSNPRELRDAPEKKISKHDYEAFARLWKAMGYEVTPEHRFHATRRWRMDFAFIKQKVSVEIDGGVWSNGRHTRGKGFLNDREKDNAAIAEGWVTLHFQPKDILSTKTTALIQQVLNDREGARNGFFGAT